MSSGPDRRPPGSSRPERTPPVSSRSSEGTARPDGPPLRLRREAAVVLTTALLAAAAVWLVGRGFDRRVRPDFCLAVGVAAALCWRLVRLTAPPPEPLPPAAEAEPAGDGLLVLTSMESRLSWGATDPDRFRERVRPLLVELATDRLRSRRGVDPRTDPDTARAILGDPLWTLMTGPLTRSPSRAELSRMVEAIERI